MSIQDKFWELTVKRLEEEKCILITGPDLSLSSDITLNERLKEYLEKQGSNKFKYYSEDEFFSFTDETEKEYAYYDVQQFYDSIKAEEIHHKIAEIPFHLVISVSPDLLLKKVFEEKSLNFNFDYYNKEQNPQSLESPSKDKPLLYNLFGNIESEGSLIFTYDDLFDYLIAIFGKRGLHNDLKREIQSARMILFLGFGFDKWYFKLLLRLLDVHKGKLSHASLKGSTMLPQARNFYSDEFHIKFLDIPGIEIIEKLHDKCAEKNLLKTIKEKKAMSGAPEIFISYGWGGESETIVDQIYEEFVNKKYNIIRDKIDLGYKGNIADFMQQIGKGKFVIVVISDKYLKSENCMYEMLELKKNGEVYNRIFPIVLGDAKIYDEIDRIDYLNYWDDKVSELKKKVETLRDPVGKVKVYEKINQYADINRIIDDITDMLRNMNTLTPDMHKEQNFQPMFDSIDKMINEEK